MLNNEGVRSVLSLANITGVLHTPPAMKRPHNSDGHGHRIHQSNSDFTYRPHGEGGRRQNDRAFENGTARLDVMVRPPGVNMHPYITVRFEVQLHP